MAQNALDRLVAHGDDEGCVCMSHLEELVQELELDDEQVEALYKQIEERGLEMTDDCCRENVPDATYINGDLVHATTDARWTNSCGAVPTVGRYAFNAAMTSGGAATKPER